MKKLFLFASIVLFAAFATFAGVSIDWLKTATSFYVNGAMVARDADDNVFATGYITNENIYTRKYDHFGNFQWEAISASGVSNTYERSTWVTIDAGGNVIVMGMRYVLASSTPVPTGVIIIKYDQNGNQLFKTVVTGTYGSSSSSKNFDERCFTDADGNIYAGAAERFPSSSPGYNAIKLSSTGDILWNKKFNTGSKYYDVNSCRLNTDGTFILTGTSATSALNVTTVAFDAEGDMLWNSTVNGLGGNDVLFDNSGNAYVLTTYSTIQTGLDFVLLKYSASGTLLYTKFYDSGSAEVGGRMVYTADNALVLTGVGTQLSGMPYVDWITMKVDLAGNSLWTQRYNHHQNNDEIPYFITSDNLSNVFITGSGGPYPGGATLSALQMVTLKYTPAGVEEWADVNDSTAVLGVGIAVASDHSLFVAGQTSMTVIHYLDNTGGDPCSVPTNLSSSGVTNNSATIHWNAVINAYLYHLQYKTSGAASWNSISTDAISFTLSGLFIGTAYDYRVEAICNSGPTGYSAIKQFNTSGTGYCTSKGLSTSKEYIDLVWLGSIFNATESNNGYGDFTNLSTNLVQGSTNTITLRVTMLFGTYNETYRVWIDYNHDGDFTDAGEKEVGFKSSAIGYNIKTFTVPLTATPGLTRMRVSMKKGNPAQTPCDTFNRGEVEDYSVNILPGRMGSLFGSDTNEGAASLQLFIYPNPAIELLHVVMHGFDGTVVVQVFDLAGKLIQAQVTGADSQAQLDIHSLPQGVYILRVTNEEGKMLTGKWIKE